MPVQYLYPTGIATSTGATWMNQAGQQLSVAGIADIDEGMTSPDGAYHVANYLGTSHGISYLMGPVLVNPQSIKFKCRVQASGTLVDSVYRGTYSFTDRSNRPISNGNVFTFTDIRNSFRDFTLNDTIDQDPVNIDFSDTRLLFTFTSENSVVGSGVMIDALEIEISGGYLYTYSGIPLIMGGAERKGVTITPEALSSQENRWFGNYNYSSIFNLVYGRAEENTGNIIYSENSNTSGVYYVTSQGLSSGLLWHNKRRVFNTETTYGLGPKFNSVNDSAFVFNSGILYNRSSFTAFARYFPSGNMFSNENTNGYFTILNNSSHEGTASYTWKVETSGYKKFKLSILDSGYGSYNKEIDCICPSGFDLLFSYNTGSGYLYIQNHINGNIASGYLYTGSILQSHINKFTIGGILESGV